MSEPVNPLFEEEKEFLERKKLEYERALRGDVEHLKEQGVQVGKVALIGAGAVAGIWLLGKALGGRKRRKAREWDDEDYDPDFRDPDYHSQYFADLDDDERWTDPADHYFGGDDDHGPGHDHGAVYHTDTDRYDDPSGPRGTTRFDEDDEADDNGLGGYPDFPAHSAAGHGEARPFYSEEHSHPEANLPYDDSRRLPDGDEFAEAKGPGLGVRLLTFAKSDLGKAVLGQAVSLLAALAAKALGDRFATDEADTANTSDLAASTEVSSDGYAHGHPATPQPAAPDASAYSAADATTYREPLA